MSEKDDSSWVFDSLVGFLQGPIWSAPLLTFIEEKSLIFDGETEDSEEYRHIYQEYKNLVDLLLGCYMEDMGITPEQFEHACTLNKNTKMPIQFQQSLFEQIWAANEYEIFKRMMIQKNLELQLQALSLIEQKYGLTPASLICDEDGLRDELVMEELLQKQYELEDETDTEQESDQAMRREHQRLATQYKTERQLLERALMEEPSAKSSSGFSPEQERRETEKVVSVEPLQLTNTALKSKKFGVLQPIPQKLKKPGEDKIGEEIELVTKNSDRKQSLDPALLPAASRSKLSDAGDEEIRKRQIYLKTQRDKLVSMKKEARSQRLKTNAARPGSARVVAEASMMGMQDLESPQLLMEDSKIQVRKALAARLKAEVVRK
ncbi:cilia- and flagella-associated protein 36 isoform X1 [Neodiprion virginianus]|uniref:cilia- and flagella-associated protein 36 isoform X1 n=1 Tax=Neodiprion virginianus TaxID=2961670 RepID=UPI001EE6E6B3|nr:cilia- and flagella-associated protein 36 isoform X1 [Neodiprion virginianus]